MNNPIAVKTSADTVRLISREQVDHLYVSVCNLGGEEALALTMCKWNADESVDWETLKSAVLEFFTNTELLRKELIELLK